MLLSLLQDKKGLSVLAMVWLVVAIAAISHVTMPSDSVFFVEAIPLPCWVNIFAMPCLPLLWI